MRSDHNWTAKFLSLDEAVRRLRRNWPRLDGERVVFDEAGQYRFQGASSRPTLKNGGQMPISPEASPSDGFLSPKDRHDPPAGVAPTYPQVGWPTAVSWHAQACRLIQSGRASWPDRLMRIKEVECVLVISFRV